MAVDHEWLSQAHGMLPHLGAGAGQGLEDAYLLCKLLSHRQTTLQNVEVRFLNLPVLNFKDLILQQAVLRAYDEVRRPRAQRVWEGSVYAGCIYEGYGKSQPFPEGLQEDLPGLWDFVWQHGLEDDLRAAEQILSDSGVFVSSEDIHPQS